jgi:hypothetical protein
LFDDDREDTDKYNTTGQGAYSPDGTLWVDEMLNQLSPVERQVISIYAGLYDDSIKECRRIAKIVGLKESQTKRSLESGLAKLRRLAGNGATPETSLV